MAQRDLFSYRLHWAHRLGPAPFLPMSRAEMDHLGWDACDVILVTGDAYVDHPSFGMAIIGRLLEAQGFRVGIIAQPDWTSVEAFRVLGRPTLYFGVTAGNMDSMVNRYTADRRLRHDDAYSPNGEGGRRPDRAAIVYAQRCREAFRDVPVVLGGIEASLRRIAHYDYWSDQVRRSILLDAKADILLFGNAERAVVELTHRLARGGGMDRMRDLRGVALVLPDWPPDVAILDASDPDRPGGERGLAPRAPGRRPRATAAGGEERRAVECGAQPLQALRLPAFEAVRTDPVAYVQASRLAHLESNPGHARPLVQRHGDRDLWISAPPLPLSTPELDRMYDLPFARAPHPSYGDARIPAWEMIRFSVTILRGCFGGCSFCSITEHEGKIIQSRSEDSIAREVAAVRDKTAGFTGVISDLGGPSANMWGLNCVDPAVQAVCRRWSCLYPAPCKNLMTDQTPLIRLYRRVRGLAGIKKVTIASGLRYDLAVRTPAYVRELVTHHVGGYLKIAPEHIEPGPLAAMQKPGLASYQRFKTLFDQASRAAGKEQYLIPYFIAAHPGTRDADMLALALWLKQNGFRLDQVQTFLPTPMAVATTMYHTGRSPLAPVRRADSPGIPTAKGLRQRRLHKAFLRYHDPANWPLLREALRALGRTDLIGPGKRHLVPAARPGERIQSASPPSGRDPGPGVGPFRRPTAGGPQGRKRSTQRTKGAGKAGFP